jgi:hypothetical protein
MVRGVVLSLVAAAVMLVGSNAVAQTSGNPALQALIAFANLLDPQLIEELRATFPTDEDLAQALVASLESRGVIDAQTALEMRFAVNTGVLPRATLVVFLADVANGSETLSTRDAAVLEVELAVIYELSVPAGDAAGNLTAADVSAVVTEVAVGGDGILAEIEASYEDAVTPRTADEAQL